MFEHVNADEYLKIVKKQFTCNKNLTGGYEAVDNVHEATTGASK